MLRSLPVTPVGVADAGGGAVKLSKDDKGTITVAEAYFSRNLKNHHGGMVLVDAYLYGSFDPGILTCIEFKTGKVMWEDRRPGKGSIMYADGRLYCRNEGREGTIYLVETNPNKYEERGRFNPPDRTREQAWPHRSSPTASCTSAIRTSCSATT